MTNLAINDETFARLQRLAEAQHIPADTLADRAIQKFLNAQARRQMQSETEAFRALHPTLLATYPNQYVAVHGGQLVDHDPDQLAVFTRVEKQWPSQVVLIAQVVSAVEEVYTV